MSIFHLCEVSYCTIDEVSGIDDKYIKYKYRLYLDAYLIMIYAFPSQHPHNHNLFIFNSTFPCASQRYMLSLWTQVPEQLLYIIQSEKGSSIEH